MSRKRSSALVGAMLKKARERRGISLRQVSDSTKISVPLLQALERDDISHLPGGVLGRGFVRSFAAAVHLDPEATVAAFVAQFPSESVNDGYPAAQRADDETTDAPIPRKTAAHRWPSYTRLGVAAVFVAAVLGVSLLLLQATSGPQSGVRTTAAVPTAKPADSEAQQSTSHAAPALADAPGTAVASPSLTPSAETPVEPAAEPPAALVEPMPVEAATDAPAAATDSPTISSSTDRPPEGTGNRLRIVLSATSPSWVTALVDGKKTVARLFEAGDAETLEARRELTLTAGDGGAVVMTINGVAAKPLSQAGKTVTVHVNRNNYQSYLRGDTARAEAPRSDAPRADAPSAQAPADAAPVADAPPAGDLPADTPSPATP